jgi:hypothetical protein
MSTCENCKHWDSSANSAHDEIDATGMCRRDPPGFDERTGLAVWPFTRDDDWCAAISPTVVWPHTLFKLTRSE